MPETALDIKAMLSSRAELLRSASERALAYLEQAADRRVSPEQAAVAALGAFDFELPASGLAETDVLRLLDETGSPATVVSNGPRYFGFVTGGALPIAQAATWLGSAWDQNGAMSVMSPVAARLDAIAISWVSEALGLPAGSSGAFVTGATMANATCLAAARDAVLTGAGWDAVSQGLVGAPPVTVVVGAEVHTTVRKALGIVGLGRDRAIVLPVDGNGAVDPRELPVLGGPAIVCLQAGNVNTGASDPFDRLISWARKAGAWVHVDGAFGLWAAASQTAAEQVSGASEADSWATDCHKWLNTTYDCGVALVRDLDSLRLAMQASASYLPGGPDERGMALTPQSSQRARGVEVWAVLAALGRDGLAALVDNSCRLARRLADGLRTEGFHVLNDVVLNQVLVSFGEPDRTDDVIAAVQQDGTCWCGPTTWHDIRAMRVSVSGWSTTDDDIDRSVAAITACAKNVG